MENRPFRHYAKLFLRSKLSAFLLISLFLSACTSRDERKVEYLNRAKNYFAEQNFEKARIDVRNALQIDENFAEARYLYAQLLEQEQNWAQMVGNLQLVLELDENHLPARVKYGTLLLAGRQFERANVQADKAIEQDSTHAEAYALKAAIQFQQGNNESAISWAQKALVQDPANISAVAVLTEAHKTENPELALQLIEQGISRQSDSAALKLMRVAVFEANKNFEEASLTYESLIKDYPDNLYYHYRYVSLLESQQQHNKASELIRSIAQAQPDEVQIKLWLVQYLVNHKDLATAEQTLRNYISQRPDQFDLQIGLGSILLAQNKNQQAREHYLQLVSDQEETELAQRSRMALSPNWNSRKATALPQMHGSVKY